MTRSPTRKVSVLAGAVFVAFSALALADVPAAPAVGTAPPEIKAGGWINGKDVSLAKLKGKPVVVEFWATWCPPCRKSIPHLIKLHEEKAKSGLVVIGLSDESKDKIEPFVAKMKMTYIVGYESKSGAEYGVNGIPHAFVIGGDGKVVWSGHPMDEEFEKMVDKAIAEARPKK